MATRAAGDKGPVVHPVLATLAGDVHPGDAVRLQGYVGPTKNGETLRLYAALEDLSDYIDIPLDEVLRSAEAPEAVAPKGGVYVWVKPDAQLVYTRTHSATALARDLGGASALEAQLANEFRRRNPGATVLTSLTAGTNALAFVEFRPGLTGVVESAPEGQPSKIDALRGRTLSSIFSELSRLPTPPALLHAAGRTMAAPPARAPKPPQTPMAHGMSAAQVSTPPTSDTARVRARHIAPATPPEQS